MNMEALPVVTLNPKHKCSELSQHRTRRPFSVQEVEAQVEAVEKLGTGRWQDIKMRAFKNADHRTYVDLKDKWKTLVHRKHSPYTKKRRACATGAVGSSPCGSLILVIEPGKTRKAAGSAFKNRRR